MAEKTDARPVLLLDERGLVDLLGVMVLEARDAVVQLEADEGLDPNLRALLSNMVDRELVVLQLLQQLFGPASTVVPAESIDDRRIIVPGR